jgi:cell division protein ZapD
MRAFLRLEFLWNQAPVPRLLAEPLVEPRGGRACSRSSPSPARGDARGDVLKELERQMGVLKDYQNRPGVDGASLRAVLATLVRRREELNSVRWPVPAAAARLGVPERHQAPQRDPGRHLRVRPAGLHPLAEPAPRSSASATSSSGSAACAPLCESISELLWVTRENARPRNETRGRQLSDRLRARAPGQLLRIELPGDSELFPEVSGSHYRCSIRFLRWNGVMARPVQPQEDVPFVLTICH